MLSRNEIKYIQSLSLKKNSNAADVFVAEGVKLLHELLHSEFAIQKIYAVKSWIENNSKYENITEVSDDELKRISHFETPNKVLAVVYKKHVTTIPLLKNKITLVVDGIQNPGNLGTIIRTADWFGIENIIASADTADLYNSKVLQASMGSFIRVQIFYTDLPSFFSSNKINVYGAVLNGEDINTLKSVDECLLIVGNESKGIRNAIIPFIQNKITIPRFGNAESLNVAVATGIILFRMKM